MGDLGAFVFFVKRRQFAIVAQNSENRPNTVAGRIEWCTTFLAHQAQLSPQTFLTPNLGDLGQILEKIDFGDLQP